MLIEQGTDDVIDELVFAVGHVQAEGDDEEHQSYNDELAQKLKEELKEFLHKRFPPFLVCHGVVKLYDGRVKRLLVENNGHIVVDAVSHILTGHGAAVLKVMLNEDEVEAEVARLLLHESVDAEHTLAGDIVVEEDHIAVEVLCPLPDGVDILPAADGVVTHGGLLGEESQILDGLLGVLRVDHVVTHRGVHVQDDVDAPAVLRPGREVGIIDCGGSPQEGAVARPAAEGLVLLFICLAHDLDDLAVDLVEVRIGAVDGSPGVQAVERLGNAAEGGVGGLEVIPLLKLDGVLLVHELCVLEQLVPVVLYAIFLLNESDGILKDLSGIGVCARLVVDHGQRYGEVRQVHAAALDHRGALGGVAGHVGSDEGLADYREGVVYRNAGLSRAAGADVSRQTEGFGNVDIIRLYMLVNIADDELRQRLEREGDKTLEAGHEQRRQNLVKGNEVIAARAAAETLVVCEHERDALCQALDDGVHIRMGGAQLIAAEALEQTVDKHKGAEVRAHPTVLPEALEAGNRSGGDHLHHAQQVIEPLGVIIKGVLHAAPFAPFGDAGLVIVAGALTAGAMLGLPEGIEAFKLFINSGYKLICCFHISLASLYLLDFQRLNKGLEAGAELADRAESVFFLDGAGGDAELVCENVVREDLFVAPELAELHVLIDDAVGMELIDKALDLAVALVYLLAVHEAGALVPE